MLFFMEFDITCLVVICYILLKILKILRILKLLRYSKHICVNKLLVFLILSSSEAVYEVGVDC